MRVIKSYPLTKMELVTLACHSLTAAVYAGVGGIFFGVWLFAPRGLWAPLVFAATLAGLSIATIISAILYARRIILSTTFDNA